MMYKKLEKYVKKQFSGYRACAERNRLRGEITQNVKERFEDELASGKSESEAYEVAAASIGNVEEMLASCGVEKKQPFGAAQWFCLLIGVIGIAITVYRAVTRSDFITVFINAGYLLFIVGIALFARKHTTEKERKIVAAVGWAGAVIAFLLLLLLPPMIKGRSLESEAETWHIELKTEETVSLIEFVTFTRSCDSFGFDSYRSEKLYTKDGYQELLDDLTGLEYHYSDKSEQEFGRIEAGERAILVSMEEPDGADVYYLLRQNCPYCIKRDRNGVLTIKKSYRCDPGRWEELLERYTGN